MNSTAQKRALVTCFALAGCFTVFSFRLVNLQVTKHDEYAAQAAANHVMRQTITARRGLIQDIHGESLAQNEPVRTVVADATLISDRNAMAELISTALKMPHPQVMEKLNREVYSQALKKNVPVPYIVLKKEVPDNVASELAAQLEKRRMRGVYFEPGSTRVYPNEQMLCHILGYVNGANVGVDGVERTMEDFLRGHDGFRYSERDRTGREIVPYRGQEKEARNGNNVRLCIDMGLQNIVEMEIEAAYKQFRPKSATIILMQPKTGEILALANRPNFNLNVQENVPEDHRRNRAVSDILEPGSTFKVVTAAAALSEKLVQPQTMINCENGYFAAVKLHDHHPYPDLSVHDILVKSSNIGVAKLAMQLGDQKFYEYVRRFGFGERTGVNLPGEVGGIVHPPHKWSKISITRMPMGQEVSATPLQVAAAMCAIANGGHLMMPQIIHDITDDQGHVLTQFPPQEVRTVASKKATDAVRDALVEVVSPRGTATLAQVMGYKVAGKTGTAQKLDADGHYSHDHYVTSFVGFMPAEDPAFVALVLIDDPQVSHDKNYGGMVAAPVFSRIGEKAARYLNLKATEVVPTGSVMARQSTGDFRDQ
ncbi:MAG: penicillin-binding protein 2 [Chthoniobacter sp.]|uniref:peptidoglycan D,D-transpeptidase FtsI family protein n=1 Tax=Chthoniobacter sp. TaxID=2510640 RepID=UPI0032A68096